MKRILALALLLVVPVVANALPQAPKPHPSAAATLTNKDVLSMLKAGLPAPIVVAKIKNSTCHFDTSPKELKALQAADVPDSVILAMVEAGGKPNTAEGKEERPGRPRVYVTDSKSWVTRGGFGAAGGVAAGASTGGSSPQTVEVIKTFGQRCPKVVVTENRNRADFVVLFDRESFKGFIRKRDKIAVFRHNGDVLYSNSVRSVGNAVKDACKAILKDESPKN